MNIADVETNYQSMFVEYVISGVQEALERVRAAEPLPDEHDRQFAWHILSYAFNFAEAWPCTRELLLALAPKMEQAGFREDWLLYLQEGHRQAQAQQDELVAAECELQIGLLYRLLSRFADAHQWTSVSVEHFAALSDTQRQARALNELAWLAHLQHQYDQAIQYVEQALALTEGSYPERAMSYRIKGMIAIGQLEWQQAEQAHGKALNLFQQLGDFRKTAWSQQNLGYALSKQNRLAEAIEFYQQSAYTLQSLGDHYHWAIVQMNTGLAYMYNDQPSEAHLYYKRAEKTFFQLGAKQMLAKVYVNLGLNHLALNDLFQAQQAFATSVDLFQQLGDDSERLNAIDGLAMVYLAQKQFEQARNVLYHALTELPQIIDKPNYEYLLISLHSHLEEAKKG